MLHEFVKKVKNSIKHWYIPLIVGLLFIGIGLMTMFKPAESYLGLAMLFIVAFIVGGLLEIIFAVSNKDVLDHWGWELASGILSFIIGIIMAMKPELSVVTLPFYVGFVIMFRSIFAISSSIELKKYGVMDWGNLMAMGILGLILSFILLWNPLFAGLTIVLWTGMAFVFVGGYSIYYSTKLRKLHKMGKEIREDINE